ncbi:chitin deacetylase 8 [Octopus bimaculoides]|uniref:NodB homology domain-containing protein n=1 Tax=Octopus bimaculoides TaxID=37653 RepID=A0A0L8GNJ6_OCTBM|nr:chitin deacetylase 8 [Octopus bimaculoides]|eukprot:XP_014779402.1 PREDICTED: uncharacterized protein LOC106875676 [Octopus bimaculoides]
MMGHRSVERTHYFLVVLVVLSASMSLALGLSVADCRLPDCKGVTSEMPKGFSRKEIPQIVLVTFDDGFTEKNIKYYRELSASGLKNPNGCPVSFTFFISGENNYTFSKEMYDNGHEMASHTISHAFPIASWSNKTYAEYRDEINGIKKNLVEKSGIPESEIKGFRSPFLQMGGDIQFQVLKDLGYDWDSSIVMGTDSDQDREQYWPFTLDTPLKNELEQEKSNGVPGKACMNEKCPTKSYPGLWEIPVNRWYDKQKKPCSLYDGCDQPTNKEEFVKFMKEALYKNYDTNRAPAGLFLHVNWVLSKPYRFEVLKQYLEEISQMEDVWILSISKALEWIKNPKKMKTNLDVDAWNC